MTDEITLTTEERVRIGDALSVGLPNFSIIVADGGPLATVIETIIRKRIAGVGDQVMMEEVTNLRNEWANRSYFQTAAMQMRNDIVTDLNKILGE